MTTIYCLNDLVEGIILSRPSKTCKSPYVADVLLDNGEQVIAHAPSLGCCGYADKNQKVLLIKHINPKVCTHVIHFEKRYEKNESYLIGIHPKISEKLVKECLTLGCIDTLEQLQDIKSEQCFLNSRFDFVCKDKNGIKTIIEVKNVPCGDYEDILQKDRKNKDYTNRDINSKIAYFPDGYRKKKEDTISPRALKHIQELEHLKINNDIRCIIIFVVQRKDCNVFQGSNVDPIYKTALNKAYTNGVEIIPIKMEWNDQGICKYKGIIKFEM
jgi:sugar fermentation stimulation protein A